MTTPFSHTPLRHTPLLPGTLQNLFYPPQQYIYFARAAELPFTTGDTIRKAAWAADAAMLAYARYGERRMTDARTPFDANDRPAASDLRGRMSAGTLVKLPTTM